MAFWGSWPGSFISLRSLSRMPITGSRYSLGGLYLDFMP
jgi:hypothetical protein